MSYSIILLTAALDNPTPWWNTLCICCSTRKSKDLMSS